MPIEPFDFTYTLNSETTQTELLNTAIAATAKVEFAPISRFFVDETKLASIVSTNYATDAFGPVTGSETTKYRTTSVVRATGTDPVKVFAICAGQVLIQPQTGDSTKVNLIVKPSASYSPLKIKYFIYRGVNKADLISSNILQPIVNEGVNQPFFLRKLWKQYKDFYAALIDPSTGEPFPAPNEFPGFLIGYDENQPEDIFIENYFTRKEIDISYQIPLCSEGEHLGNFTGEIGLDIVLDFGDYQLQNQEELFKFNLKFARKKENIFNTLTIPSSTAVKVKRYKEYIHQFMDAAAFWGSHIECGTIVLTDASKIKTNDAIFTKIVNKYQTQNKIYVYIQGENNRSYNYYETTRKVYGFNTAGQLNDTSGWPIIIDKLTVTVSTPPKFKKGVTFNLEYNIDTRIPEPERHISLDLISPNNNTTNYPLLDRPLNPKAPATVPAFLINKTASITTNFQVNGTKSCAGFLILYGNLKQTFPLKKYYNDLWPVNFNTNFLLPTSGTENMSSWATYDKSRMVNLDDVLDVGASIQNKVVFDNGKGPAVSGTAPRKARRLYMAVLKRNSIHNTEFDNFNIGTITSGIAKSTTTQEQYALNVYNSLDFSVYKGTFIDNGTLVDSLALVNENSLVKKNSFFHLGITEEEYNKLVYGQTTIPVILPPATIVAQYLPVDADNVFFHLEEDLTFMSQNVQKFKVGFRFENNTGSITTLFPGTGNEVYVYTLDGFYFFSKEYADFQEFFEEYPKAKVDFRVTQPYAGEFGFDWMRVGDTGALGDVDYKNHVGKLYKDALYTVIETDSNEYNGHFNHIPKMFSKLEKEYKAFPFQWDITSDVDKYYAPILTIYPPYVSTIAPSIDLDRQSIFVSPYNDDLNRVANLTLKIKVSIEPTRIELIYDTKNLEVTSSANPIVIPKAVGNHSIDVVVKCLKEFGVEQQIKLIAYYGTSRKGKTIGMLRVNPNIKSKRFSKKILFIDVITNINSLPTVTPLVYTFNQHAKNLKKFLRQIFTTPIIKNETIDLVTNIDSTFNTNYIYTNALGSKNILGYNRQTAITPKANLVDYLYDKLKLQHQAGSTTPIGDLYKDYFKVFFFHDNGGRISQTGSFGLLAGYSNGEDKLVDFPNNFPSTTTHEFLHTADVQHSFTNIESSKFARYTYNPLKTDNIMDYSDVYGTPTKIPTVSLFQWQGLIAQKNFNLEP